MVAAWEAAITPQHIDFAGSATIDAEGNPPGLTFTGFHVDVEQEPYDPEKPYYFAATTVNPTLNPYTISAATVTFKDADNEVVATLQYDESVQLPAKLGSIFAIYTGNINIFKATSCELSDITYEKVTTGMGIYKVYPDSDPVLSIGGFQYWSEEIQGQPTGRMTFGISNDSQAAITVTALTVVFTDDQSNDTTVAITLDEAVTISAGEAESAVTNIDLTDLPVATFEAAVSFAISSVTYS